LKLQLELEVGVDKNADKGHGNANALVKVERVLEHKEATHNDRAELEVPKHVVSISRSTGSVSGKQARGGMHAKQANLGDEVACTPRYVKQAWDAVWAQHCLSVHPHCH